MDLRQWYISEGLGRKSLDVRATLDILSAADKLVRYLRNIYSVSTCVRTCSSACVESIPMIYS